MWLSACSSRIAGMTLSMLKASAASLWAVSSSGHCRPVEGGLQWASFARMAEHCAATRAFSRQAHVQCVLL